jgi:aspartyl-tRNA(Asn)/glutamyl-tRNA(Gln) amidotransferase subunit B
VRGAPETPNDRAGASGYELVIGFETHVELATETKMFCGCSARTFGAPPNSLTCPVCLGLPGSLPVINRRALELTIAVGLALHCEVPAQTKFDRKNYIYPDLPKGYQISQYDLPLNVRGYVEIDTAAGRKRIGIRRVHLEEDTGKLFHGEDSRGRYSLVDFNRSGVPLMEIVSDPDLSSVEEALAYAQTLRHILLYTGASDMRMEEGSVRFDSNVSIRFRDDGRTVWPPQSEIKNLNSFRAVERAIAFEADRLWREWQAGGEIRTRTAKVTMGWDDERGRTHVQRAKEAEQDYRYFPEPDLPFMAPRRELVEAVRAELPEMPEERRARFEREYGLSSYNARLLTESRELADYFEEQIRAADGATPQAVSNFVLRDVLHALKSGRADLKTLRLREWSLAPLVTAVQRGTMSPTQASAAFSAALENNIPFGEIARRAEYQQVSDADTIAAAVDQAIAENAQAVKDYRAGKTRALAAIVGAVMKKTRGKANPAMVNELLQRRLG